MYRSAIMLAFKRRCIVSCWPDASALSIHHRNYGAVHLAYISMRIRSTVWIEGDRICLRLAGQMCYGRAREEER